MPIYTDGDITSPWLIMFMDGHYIEIKTQTLLLDYFINWKH